MMKAVLAIAVVLVVGVGGYFLYGMSGNETAVTQTSTPSSSTDAPAVDDDTATAAIENAAPTVETLVEEVESAADEMKDKAEDMLEGAVQTVRAEVDALADDADTVTDAVRDQAEEAVEQTTDKVKNAIEKALDTQSSGKERTPPTAEEIEAAKLEMDAVKPMTPEQLDAALSVDAFDGLAIREAAKTMELGSLASAGLEALIAKGEQNPEQLQIIIPQIREILGL